MIKRHTPDFRHSDERGQLIQLCKNGYEQINVLYSKAGVIRGEHYHKINHEAFFVVSGSVTVEVHNKDESMECVFTSGDFFEVEPMVVHSLYFPEDCILLALYDKCVELENGIKDIYSEEE